jgi:hypothetical protein
VSPREKDSAMTERLLERLLVCPDCDNRVSVLQPHTRAWCQRHGRGVAPEMVETFPEVEEEPWRSRSTA